jgi:cyanophycin synthetase
MSSETCSSRAAAGAELDTPVPVFLVSGSYGKTSTVRMINHVLRSDLAVDERGLLAVRRATVLEIETAAVRTAGAVLPLADVAVITSQSDSERECDVQAMVLQRVRSGGAVVVNADNPCLRRLPRLDRDAQRVRRVVYFSRHERNEALRAHARAGGVVFYLKRGWLVECRAGLEWLVAPINLLPATMGGAAVFQVENALATVAACRAYGLSRAQIVGALKSFTVVPPLAALRSTGNAESAAH